MKKVKKAGKIAQAILAEVVSKTREADSDEEDITRAKVVGDEVRLTLSLSISNIIFFLQYYLFP